MEIYRKIYVNIRDIQKIFGFDFYRAREVLVDAMKIQPKNYSCTEGKVLLEKVLEVQGINRSFWLEQQKARENNGKQ